MRFAKAQQREIGLGDSNHTKCFGGKWRPEPNKEETHMDKELLDVRHLQNSINVDYTHAIA